MRWGVFVVRTDGCIGKCSYICILFRRADKRLRDGERYEKPGYDET